MTNFLLLALGVVLLTVGGEALIRGSLAVAQRFNISPLLSGLIIVGFGTSTPELVVSVNAAINQQPDIAVGNVVGSNIGNILLILGACALITPLAVRPLALRRDAVTVVLTCLLFLVLALDDHLGRLDAAVLLSVFGGYLVWAYWTERYHAAPSAEVHRAEAQEVSRVPTSMLWTVGAILLGLALLIAGSRAMLTGSVGIARSLGVSEAAIGLTIVAIGTSLPEFSVSLIAAIRRHADVAVGNILGSNIFNLVGILGVSALLQPLPLHARIIQFDQWVMLVTALALFSFLYSANQLSRLEGGLLLTGYVTYVALSFSPVVGP
jgi:cation:H+ antiporter